MYVVPTDRSYRLVPAPPDYTYSIQTPISSLPSSLVHQHIARPRTVLVIAKTTQPTHFALKRLQRSSAAVLNNNVALATYIRCIQTCTFIASLKQAHR